METGERQQSEKGVRMSQLVSEQADGLKRDRGVNSVCAFVHYCQCIQHDVLRNSTGYVLVGHILVDLRRTTALDRKIVFR